MKASGIGNVVHYENDKGLPLGLSNAAKFCFELTDDTTAVEVKHIDIKTAGMGKSMFYKLSQR